MTLLNRLPHDVIAAARPGDVRVARCFAAQGLDGNQSTNDVAVADLASPWGCERTAPGKTVWAEVERRR